MLPREENELLTRVGPGTPAGNFLRQYWVPVLRSSELAEADGRPLRVRLLCEDLILFRDSQGRVGLLANNCSHRGASLFFGRNEESGLRCVYHGWKYDVTGACVDMPNEPGIGSGMPDPYKSESDPYNLGSVGARHASPAFKDKIHQHAYPCREAGGIIWAYMGTRREPPPLPDLELIHVSEKQRLFPYVMWRHCNWLQALEGCFDPSHVFFLHSRLNPDDPPWLGPFHTDKHPRIELVPTEYGVMYGARRDEDEDHYYWRITQYLMPFIVMYPGYENGVIPGHIWVPVDDENTINWDFRYLPHRSFTEEELEREARANHAQYKPATTEPYGAWRPLGERSNDYLQDRDVQRTKTFTGIPMIALQDQAMTEGMGPIFDRTQEHLGTSDAAVIHVRRRLIEAVRALQEHGTPPPGVDSPEFYRVRSASAILPKSTGWLDAAGEWLSARSGRPIAQA